MAARFGSLNRQFQVLAFYPEHQRRCIRLSATIIEKPIAIFFRNAAVRNYPTISGKLEAGRLPFAGVGCKFRRGQGLSSAKAFPSGAWGRCPKLKNLGQAGGRTTCPASGSFRSATASPWLPRDFQEVVFLGNACDSPRTLSGFLLTNRP